MFLHAGLAAIARLGNRALPFFRPDEDAGNVSQLLRYSSLVCWVHGPEILGSTMNGWSRWHAQCTHLVVQNSYVATVRICPELQSWSQMRWWMKLTFSYGFGPCTGQQAEIPG